MELKNQKEKLDKRWLLLTNIPFQMAITILIGVFFGKWIDKMVFDSQKYCFVIITSLLSVFLALYRVIKQVNNLNK